MRGFQQRGSGHTAVCDILPPRGTTLWGTGPLPSGGRGFYDVSVAAGFSGTCWKVLNSEVRWLSRETISLQLFELKISQAFSGNGESYKWT